MGEYTWPTETISTHWCNFSSIQKTLHTIGENPTAFVKPNLSYHLLIDSAQNDNKGAKVGPYFRQYSSVFRSVGDDRTPSFYRIGREAGDEKFLIMNPGQIGKIVDHWS